jgi:DNA-directed RNA polymerase alpha subunit
MTNVFSGFNASSNINGWDNEIETQYNENVENANQRFSILNTKIETVNELLVTMVTIDDKTTDNRNEFNQIGVAIKDFKDDILEVKNLFNLQDYEVQQRLDELSAKINNNFTRL